MEFEYKTKKRSGKETTKAAHKEVRRKGLEKFKTNPTKYISKRGCMIIYIPGRGNVKEHHYVWEQNYGQIPEGYVIHHINHDPLDNRIENLQMIEKREHLRLHYRLRKQKDNGTDKFVNNLIQMKRNEKGQFIGKEK